MRVLRARATAAQLDAPVRAFPSARVLWTLATLALIGVTAASLLAVVAAPAQAAPLQAPAPIGLGGPPVPAPAPGGTPPPPGTPDREPPHIERVTFAPVIATQLQPSATQSLAVAPSDPTDTPAITSLSSDKPDVLSEHVVFASRASRTRGQPSLA